MQKLTTILFTVSVLVTMPLLATGNITKEDPVEMVVTLSEVSPEQFEPFIEGYLPMVGVLIPEGTILPLKMFLKGDILEFFSGEEISSALKLKKSLYIRNIKGRFLFSSDLNTWKPLYSFFKGQTHIGLEVDKSGIPVIKLGRELSERL